jgi:hypothetical protein
MRRKGGRPRKLTAREPSGQPQRADAATRARESILSVAEHTLRNRCRRMGWTPTEENMLAARDSRLVTMIGCLHMAGMVPERPYLGVMAYADLRARWLRSIDSPREWPSIGTYGEPLFGGGAAEIGGDAAKRLAGAYLAAEGVLVASGLKGAVWGVLTAPEEAQVSDYSSDACEGLKRAGRALAVHFGL